jgi:stage V sporulation protein AE
MLVFYKCYDKRIFMKEVVCMQFISAFVFGGLICAVGQLLIDKTALTPARILTLFVVAGLVLGALGLYEPILNAGQEGAAVPISGFGNLMAQSVREALRRDGALGILTGGVTGAAAGIAAAVFFSVVASFAVRSRDK